VIGKGKPSFASEVSIEKLLPSPFALAPSVAVAQENDAWLAARE
jgi:hypothetical protein